MSRHIVPLLIGASAFATAYSAARLLAPFCGMGPFLVTAVVVAAFAALAAGLQWSTAPARAPGGGALAIGIAATWTLLLPWISTPALSFFERFGLRAATVLGVVACVGVPFVAAGFALGRRLRAGATPEFAARTIAMAMLGAALVTPLVVWVLVPSAGVSRTLLASAAFQAAGALLAGGRAASRIGLTVFVGILVACGASAAKFPAVQSNPGQGLIEVRESPSVQYRVVEREDGLFLIADGAIQTLVDAGTHDPLMRAVAAHALFDRWFAQPESVLVLGLRGGSAAMRFARTGWRVRTVDPDPIAARVAAAHLSFHTTEAPLAVEDIRLHCRRPGPRYPLVVLDALEDCAFPFPLITREGLDAIASRVAPNGILSLSVVTRGWDDPVLGSFGATLRRRFRNVVALPTSEPPNSLGSILLVASDRRLELRDDQLPQPTDYLMNPDELWQINQMNHAWFNRYEPKTEGAVILTDDRNPIDRWSDGVGFAAREELHRSFTRPPRSW